MKFPVTIHLTAKEVSDAVGSWLVKEKLALPGHYNVATENEYEVTQGADGQVKDVRMKYMKATITETEKDHAIVQ